MLHWIPARLARSTGRRTIAASRKAQPLPTLSGARNDRASVDTRCSCVSRRPDGSLRPGAGSAPARRRATLPAADAATDGLGADQSTVALSARRSACDVRPHGPGARRTALACEPRLHPVSYTHLRAHETPEHLVCR